jgi:hypothetical protein
MRNTVDRQIYLRIVPLLCAILVGVYAAWPYIHFPGLPTDNDAELHIFRIAELGYSIAAGNPYPRWAPDFYHGYGYPIFNYYAPLIYHLGYLLTLGRPELAVIGAKLLFILAHVLGSVGAYLLGRRFGGRSGGLLGAIGFSFAPYVQLINPHIRGDLAEVFALACLPWALWAWERVWQDANVSSDGSASFLHALLWTSATFLSHNLTGLSVTVLIGIISVWRWLVGRQGRSLRFALATGVTFVLLTAFFWLPFLIERDAIMLDVAGEGHYDFHNHFVHLRELLAPLGPIDHRSTAIGVPMSAGPQILAIATGGFVLGMGRSRAAVRRHLEALGPYVLLGGLLLWLTTEYSVLVWEHLPGLDYFQFPWRFLGPLAVALVPLLARLARVRRFRWIPALAAGLMLVAGAPGLYPIPWTPSMGPITRQAIIEAELQGRWRGTTSTNDFVPATVDMIPGPEPQVIASYKNPPIDRVNRQTLPEGTQVHIVRDAPWINHFEVSTGEAFTLRLFLFDFPGWQATIDGEEVPIELAHPEGFITVRVPEGRHDVVIRFGQTPARTLGWALTGLGILVGVGMVIALRSKRVRLQNIVTESPEDGVGRLGHATLRRTSVTSIVIVVAVFGLLKIGLFDPLNLFWYTSPEGESYAAEHEQKANLNDEITLLGYDLSAQQTRPGGRLDVTLHWGAQHELTRTYQSFVHVVYPEGEIRAQSDHLNPGGFPTNLWSPDRYVLDRHQIRLPEDAPAGPYLLSVGIYSLIENRRLPVHSAECGMRPDSVVLCQTITVRR